MTKNPKKFKLAIVAPGKSHQTSVGACVAHFALKDFLENPSESGLDGIILQNNGAADSIKEHLDAEIIEKKTPVNPDEFIVVGGYNQLCKADILIICADAGTDYVRRFQAGVPPSAEDSFAVNNEVVLGGKREATDSFGNTTEEEFKGIAQELVGYGYEGSIGVVTNPSDYIAHLMQAKLFELLKTESEEKAMKLFNKVWGFTPEKQRLRKIIAQYLSQNNMPVKEADVLVHAVGPHDDRAFMVPVFSSARVEGYTDKQLEACLELLFANRHALKERLRDYAREMMVKAGNTSTEVGLYIQDPIKMMAGQKVSANISRFFKLSESARTADGKSLKIIKDFQRLDESERKKAFDEFIGQEGLNDNVRKYARAHADAITNFEKFLAEDPGAFLSLPYERSNSDLGIPAQFGLNHLRWHEQLQFLIAYMKCCEFGSRYVVPFSRGQKPVIDRSEWSRYQDMVGSRYIVIKKIGDGAQGFLLHAKDPYDKDSHGNFREVALKIYKDIAKREISKDWERFYRQVIIQSKFNHPHIIRCYGVATAIQEYPGLLLEFANHPRHGDKDLKALYVDSGKKLSYDQINNIFRSIGSALKEVHSHRTPTTNASLYVHRDIKPKNFLLTQEHGIDVIKLGDFGAAIILPEFSLTGVGTVSMGTESYLSPEGVPSDEKTEKVPLKQVTPRMDTYSAGVSLYELVTCIKPARDQKGTPHFESLVSLRRGDMQFELYDRLVQRCLDPEWEAGKTKRPMDGEEFFYEVLIASNCALVKAYETAVKAAVSKTGIQFTLEVSDLISVANARNALYAALSETTAEEEKAVKERKAPMLYKIPKDKLEAHLNNPNCIIHSTVQSDDSLEGKCKARIKSFVEDVNKNGVTPETRAMAKQYKSILGSFAKRG